MKVGGRALTEGFEGGGILVIGPCAVSQGGGGTSGLTVPAGWVRGDVYVLTGAADFLGGRVVLRSVMQELLPWSPKPLPFLPEAGGAGPEGGPGSGCAPELLADAAVRTAAAGANVLAAIQDGPWEDPLAAAVTRRAAGGDGRDAERFALSIIDLRHRAGTPPPVPSVVPLDKLAAIMYRLLGPEGCPWDREQTHETLRRYLVEEAGEVLEAIDRRQAHTLCDELGDLLLQIAFHAALGEGAGGFTLRNVVEAITEKMIHRHPHVFAGRKVGGSADVLRNWALLKREEAEEAGRPAADGTWRALRKQAVDVSLAAFEAAFAASRRDPERWQGAAAELVSGTAVLTDGGSRTLDGGTPPREEDTEN